MLLFLILLLLSLLLSPLYSCRRRFCFCCCCHRDFLLIFGRCCFIIVAKTEIAAVVEWLLLSKGTFSALAIFKIGKQVSRQADGGKRVFLAESSR